MNVFLLKPIIEYLKGQPFNNVLIAALMAVIVYFNMERNKQTDKAHTMVRTVIHEIREENQTNQNRLIFALKGVRYEIAGRSEKAADAFEKVDDASPAEEKAE